jgi:hypothetical protein
MGIFSKLVELYKKSLNTINNIQLLLIAIIFILQEYGILAILGDKISYSLIVILILSILKEILSRLPDVNENCFFPHDELYDKIKERYHDIYHKRITFYHYSGHMVHELIVNLVKRGWKIRLIVQHPDTADANGSKYQSQRIRDMVIQFSKDISGSDFPGKLEILSSKVTLTTRAVIADGDCVALGWYHYGTVTRKRPAYATDTTEIYGHNTCGVFFDKNHTHFTEACEFLKRYEDHIKPELYETIGG